MHLATEYSYAKQVGSRLPGFHAHPTSHVMLDTLTGKDTTLDFEDYLNVEQDRPVSLGRMSQLGDGIHSAMERQLGL